MKSHGREHKQKITAADALTIWRLVGCTPRGHEIVGKDEFTVDEFLEVTNQIQDRARGRPGEFYDRIFRMIDFHGRKKVSLDDLKVFTRMCGKTYSTDVLQSLVHTIDSSGNDEFITRQDFIDWWERLSAEEQEPNGSAQARSASGVPSER